MGHYAEDHADQDHRLPLSPDPMESARRILEYVAELHARGCKALDPNTQAMIAWMIVDPRPRGPRVAADCTPALTTAGLVFERLTAARDRGGFMTRTQVAAMLREDMSDATEDAEAAAYRARLRVAEIKDLVAAGATWREAVKMVDHGERMRKHLEWQLSRAVDEMKADTHQALRERAEQLHALAREAEGAAVDDFGTEPKPPRQGV